MTPQECRIFSSLRPPSVVIRHISGPEADEVRLSDLGLSPATTIFQTAFADGHHGDLPSEPAFSPADHHGSCPYVAATATEAGPHRSASETLQAPRTACPVNILTVQYVRADWTPPILLLHSGHTAKKAVLPECTRPGPCVSDYLLKERATALHPSGPSARVALTRMKVTTPESGARCLGQPPANMLAMILGRKIAAPGMKS